MCLDYRMPFPLKCPRSSLGWLVFIESVLSLTSRLTPNLRHCPPPPKRSCCFWMGTTFPSRDLVWQFMLGHPRDLHSKETGICRNRVVPEACKMKEWQHSTWGYLSQWCSRLNVAQHLRTQLFRLPHVASLQIPTCHLRDVLREVLDPLPQTQKHHFLLMT